MNFGNINEIYEIFEMKPNDKQLETQINCQIEQIDYKQKYEELEQLTHQYHQRLESICNLMKKHSNETQIESNQMNTMEIISEIERLVKTLQQENEFAHSFSQQKFSTRETRKRIQCIEKNQVEDNSNSQHRIKSRSYNASNDINYSSFQMNLPFVNYQRMTEKEERELSLLNEQSIKQRQRLLERRRKSITYKEDFISENSIMKCVFLGDENSGKTQIISSFKTQQFPPNEVVNCEETQIIDVPSKNGELTISIVDVFSEEENQHLRQIIYSSANVFVICFSLIDCNSFSNVIRKWIPEILKYRPELPIILCGSHFEEVSDIIPYSLIQNTVIQQKIYRYIECNSYTGKNINQLFETIGNLSIDMVDSLQSNCCIC